MKLYSIKDDKSQTFQGCYTFVNDAIAIREFDAAFKTGKLGLVSQYPADFAIYRLGDLDDANGVIAPKVELVKNFQDYAMEAKNNG